MKTIVNIKNHGSFTEEDRITVKALLRREAFPQFYTNIEFKSLEYKDVILVDESLIERDIFGSSQTPREEGLNSEYDKLKQDITENGFRLYDKPIFVRRTQGGKFALVDGRTKDKILSERKFKNRICVLVEIDSSDLEYFSKRLNAGEGTSPAGLIKEIDIVKFIHREIESGNIELDQLVILDSINKICGTGKFSSKKRSDLSFLIYNHVNSILTSNLIPVAWANNKEVDSWLISTNYIETPTVVYLPYAASSPMKAVFAAAALSKEKPNKEIRVVIYVSKLIGYDLKDCYLKAILKFKDSWYDYMASLGRTYFANAKQSTDIVKLYGCVPNNIEDVCDDMNKLIIFGKNDQKIDKNYLVNKNLSNFFDLDIEDGEENE